MSAIPGFLGNGNTGGGLPTASNPIYPQQYNAAPASSFTGAAAGNVQGQVSLGILSVAIVSLVAFYIITRKVQGGG